MGRDEKINILLVDDQPAKLISYEVMLGELHENLIKATSAREALEQLLKNEIAVVLIDVCMPDLDGFELAAMIREHPRFQQTAIIFVSAIHLADDDRLRGYRMGAVDYMPVPVVPEILRAKVKVFAELYRKTRQLEELNYDLERRVAARTAELEDFNARLSESEEQLRLATEAAEIGLWDVDRVTDTLFWPPRVKAMFGISPDVPVTMADFYAGLHPDDREAITAAYDAACDPVRRARYDVEYRTIGKEDGVVRWVAAKGRGVFDANGECVRVLGTALDITARKRAEEHHALLAREVDHRAKNALAVVQSIIRLTRGKSVEEYVKAVDGRIAALSHAHMLLSKSRWRGASLKTLLADELAPYQNGVSGRLRIEGPEITLEPATAQSLALVLHELATNSAKYGALSAPAGKLSVTWAEKARSFTLDWQEKDGPTVTLPAEKGFGLKVIGTIVQSQLRGDIALEWNSDGLHCSLLIPTTDLDATDGPKETENQESAQPRINGRNILLVEDEALISMMMEDALAEIGFSTVGPYARVDDAIKAAQSAALAAAILDINLAGQTVYELADVLQRRQVPFIFVTGYEQESLDPRFANVSVLRKPVDREKLRTILSSVSSPKRTAAAV